MFGMRNKHFQVKLATDPDPQPVDTMGHPIIQPIELTSLAVIFVNKTAGAIAGLMILRTVCRIAEKRLS